MATKVWRCCPVTEHPMAPEYCYPAPHGEACEKCDEPAYPSYTPGTEPVPSPEYATCSGCGVVIHCTGGDGIHTSLPNRVEDLAREFEEGALFRTGAGVAKKLRALLYACRTPDAETES